MKFVLDKTSKQYDLMGGKGTALVKINTVIDNIPEFFIVSYQGFDLENRLIFDDAKEEVEAKLKEFDDDTYFAVRSSASNEDSTEASFAGQFDTFLYVKKDDVINKLKEVYMSVYSDRIETYRRENNITQKAVPSVIIQKMIMSEKSGVAFAANPITSNVKEVVISAVYGLGTGLVDGDVTSDTYTILNNEIKKVIGKKDLYNTFENNEIIQKEIGEDKKNTGVLTEKEIWQINKLVKQSSEFFGRFQDIEWTIENGKLYLLQSRPITTLGKTKDKNEKINVFDNSNIVESYGGITTPLTFSFIRMVYENVYKQLCKMVNIKQEKIEINSRNV